jgi:UDP-N-acetylmuramyl pentapeptide phosphotransferase/UDP-N-acetylglucosamine-1-phosphate transferase
MEEDVFMGSAGSLTVGRLVIAVAFLLRSFYKRFMGVNRSDDSKD